MRTERTFFSAGTELANCTAKESAVYQKGAWCAYPWRAGYANVVMVEAVGSAVTRVAKGQRRHPAWRASPPPPFEGNLTAAFSEIHCRNIVVRGAPEVFTGVVLVWS